MYDSRRTRRGKIQGGNVLTGTQVTFKPGPYQDFADMVAAQDHVADAFTNLAYLVILKYAQRTFYVTVKNVEANTAEEAVKLAVRRSRKCFEDLGNLMEAECRVDTVAERERLKLGHEFDAAQVSHTMKWRNAA